MKATLLGILLLAAGSLALGCEGEGVGHPCIPEDEYRADFGGYSKDEVNIESRSFQCETRVCLVNNFQGRVSCPYGQGQTQLDSETKDDDCQLPDVTGYVTEPVAPQLQSRRPADAVYCSCRCDGPQTKSNAAYCECPSGFDCRPLIDNLGLGKAELVGSYCVREGTYFDDPSQIDTSSPCDRTSESCGDPRDIF
jgi:hypothetical protein